MTRGRRKDLTIPTSRALTQQRDYRARKAKYVADLEERCRRAELENEKLRRELELAKGGLPGRQATVNSEAAQATTELMQHLSAALASLSRFQQLAINDNQPLPAPVPTQSCPSLLPSPATSSPFSPIAIPFYPMSYDEINAQTESFPKPIDPPSNIETVSHIRRSPSSDEECCGGLIDCRFLDDEPETVNHMCQSPSSDEECCGGLIDCLLEDEPEEDIVAIPSGHLVKNSNIRSTSDGAPTL